MVGVACEVELDDLTDKLEGAGLEECVAKVCREHILPDCNRVIPVRSGALAGSGSVSGDEITWGAAHASRVYHTNKHGGSKWDSRAWHRNKRKWCQALADEITRE